MSLWPRAINILISNWSQTQKFSQSFKNTSREDGSFSLFSSLNFIRLLRVVVTPSVTWEKKTTRSNRMNFRLTFLTIVTRWSRSTIVQCLCSDWSKFDRWVHAEKLYSILKLVYFDSWSWRYFSTGCIKWKQLISTVFFYSWLVCYWIFGWEMRRLSKLEIRFRMTSFSFFTLLDAGWKVPQAILALLDSFQELHLEW